MELSHLPDDAYTLESSGVDWLTATAYRNPSRSRFYELGKDLIATQASYGCEMRDWRAGGYHGQQCGGVAFGVRHDTWILKLSSDAARDHWHDATRESTNVTRIDLQLTIRLVSPNTNFFATQRERALKHRRGRGRRANVTLISSSMDGDSLYLGKRSSSLYARVYDKGKEQKTERAGVLVRQEVEAKAEAVKPLVEQLNQSASVESECARLVASYMESFAIQTIRGGANFLWGARGRATRPDAGLHWLRSSCAPTVKRLADCGRLDEVLDALGISELVIRRASDNEN
jgi:DNA relaxase NicK